MPCPRSGLRNERGQSVVEMVLILVIFMSTTFLISGYMKQNRVMFNLVTGPWERIQGMIESGVWKPADQAKIDHPSHLRRHQTPTDL